jgi:hypothetical protein
MYEIGDCLISNDRYIIGLIVDKKSVGRNSQAFEYKVNFTLTKLGQSRLLGFYITRWHVESLIKFYYKKITKKECVIELL